MDALDILQAQHAEILGLFDRASALDAGDRWCALDILVDAIELHLRVTPICAARTRAVFARGADDSGGFERARNDLIALDPADLQFQEELSRVREQVLRHCRYERERLFPAIERQLDRRSRLALANEMLAEMDRLERDERHIIAEPLGVGAG